MCVRRADAAVAGEIAPGGSNMGNHCGPDRGTVMRAVDPGAIHPSRDQSAGEGGILARLGRQCHHDAGARPLGIAAEKPLLLASQNGGPRVQLGGVGVRPRGGSGEPLQRRQQRVERNQHPRLAAPERGKSIGRKGRLERAQIAAAQRQIMREIFCRRLEGGTGHSGAP
jgi:hypothetical protein